MRAATRNFVRLRAENRCEYCGLTENQSPLNPLHIEHIIPRKHRGTDSAENLAVACIDCNLHKSCNLTGFDPVTGLLTELFHPRRHAWHDHFEWRGVLIAGRTPIGRTTVEVLDLNGEARLELRMVARE